MKKKLKTAMGRLAGITGAYERSFRSKVVIVAFHRVSDQLASDGLTCSSAKFEAFCGFFRKHFRVISLSQQIAECSAGGNPGGTLSITFDDGYLDNFEVAAPILRKFGLPATFFVTTGFLGTQCVAPWDKDLTLQPGWMSWEHVRELEADGFEIGSHTDSHIDMGKTDSGTVREELELSKRKIEGKLGASVDLFAYPFGAPDNISERCLELVRDTGYSCCVSCHGGVNAIAADPYRLKRIPIAEWFDTPNQFGFELLRSRA